MTLTNVLATTEAVKTLKGMTFDPVKALEAMGYTLHILKINSTYGWKVVLSF